MQLNWMKLAIVSTFCGALLAAAYLVPTAFAQEESKPKHTIKEIMKVAHDRQAGILGKVLSGEATDEQKKELLDLYISMVESEPPKGELNSWHELAGKTILAAAKVVVGREGAVDELKAATNCANCHRQHKPS